MSEQEWNKYVQKVAKTIKLGYIPKYKGQKCKTALAMSYGSKPVKKRGLK